MKRELVLPALVTLTLGAAVAIVAWLLVRSTAPPDGPVEVLWDRTPCARCRMLVGEREFAAQLQTTGGDVLDFDDPGCLLFYLDEASPEVSAMYFRHHREDRWLARDQVGFVFADPTPMGYQLGAVERTEPGAIDLESARAKLRAPGHPATAPKEQHR